MDENLNPVIEGQEPVVEVQNDATVTEPVEAKKTEVADPSQEKPKQSAEENAKYAAARRKAEAEKVEAIQRARDEFAATLARRAGLEHITTADAFESYMSEMEAQNAGIEPEVYQKLRENDPEVKRAKEILARQERAEKDLREFGEFREAFREANGREFDIQSDGQLYAEVRAEAEKSGKSISDVFARHSSKSLLARLAELEAKLKAQDTNAANATSTPGSVKSDGNPAAGADYITPEQFEQNRRNADWVKRNYDKILKSRPKWGG